MGAFAALKNAVRGHVLRSARKESKQAAASPPECAFNSHQAHKKRGRIVRAFSKIFNRGRATNARLTMSADNEVSLYPCLERPSLGLGHSGWEWAGKLERTSLNSLRRVSTRSTSRSTSQAFTVAAPCLSRAPTNREFVKELLKQEKGVGLIMISMAVLGVELAVEVAGKAMVSVLQQSSPGSLPKPPSLGAPNVKELIARGMSSLKVYVDRQLPYTRQALQEWPVAVYDAIEMKSMEDRAAFRQLLATCQEWSLDAEQNLQDAMINILQPWQNTPATKSADSYTPVPPSPTASPASPTHPVPAIPPPPVNGITPATNGHHHTDDPATASPGNSQLMSTARSSVSQGFSSAQQRLSKLGTTRKGGANGVATDGGAAQFAADWAAAAKAQEAKAPAAVTAAGPSVLAAAPTPPAIAPPTPTPAPPRAQPVVNTFAAMQQRLRNLGTVRKAGPEVERNSAMVEAEEAAAEANGSPLAEEAAAEANGTPLAAMQQRLKNLGTVRKAGPEVERNSAMVEAEQAAAEANGTPLAETVASRAEAAVLPHATATTSPAPPSPSPSSPPAPASSPRPSTTPAVLAQSLAAMQERLARLGTTRKPEANGGSNGGAAQFAADWAAAAKAQEAKAPAAVTAAGGPSVLAVALTPPAIAHPTPTPAPPHAQPVVNTFAAMQQRLKNLGTVRKAGPEMERNSAMVEAEQAAAEANDSPPLAEEAAAEANGTPLAETVAPSRAEAAVLPHATATTSPAPPSPSPSSPSPPPPAPASSPRPSTTPAVLAQSLAAMQDRLARLGTTRKPGAEVWGNSAEAEAAEAAAEAAAACTGSSGVVGGALVSLDSVLLEASSKSDEVDPLLQWVEKAIEQEAGGADALVTALFNVKDKRPSAITTQGPSSRDIYNGASNGALRYNGGTSSRGSNGSMEPRAASQNGAAPSSVPHNAGSQNNGNGTKDAAAALVDAAATTAQTTNGANGSVGGSNNDQQKFHMGMPAKVAATAGFVGMPFLIATAGGGGPAGGSPGGGGGGHGGSGRGSGGGGGGGSQGGNSGSGGRWPFNLFRSLIAATFLLFMIMKISNTQVMRRVTYRATAEATAILTAASALLKAEGFLGDDSEGGRRGELDDRKLMLNRM